MDVNSRARLGCTISLAALILGVVVGATGMAAFLGLGLGDLMARASGHAAPALVAVTPTAAVQIVGGAAPGRRLVWREPIALDGDTREPDLLVISRNHDRKSDTILLLSPDAGAVRWESAPMGDSGNSWVVAYSAQTIIVADGSKLTGLSRADGSRLWEAPLTDRIFYNGCAGCLQVFDDVVVALTDDGELQAFSAAKGAPLWHVRLNQTTRQLVRVGDMVGVPDTLTKDSSDAGLLIYSPADGKLQRTLTPSCAREGDTYADHPGYYDRILADPQAGALYWLLDGAGCLIKVGMGAGGGERRTYGKDLPSFEEHNALLADGVIYLGDSKQIFVIDARGAARALIANADYDMQPLEAQGDALLVLARRTRGSSRLELWLVDAQSGRQRWARVLKAGDPISGPYDDGDFAAHMLAGSVALIEQLKDSEQIQFDLLSLKDGTSSVSTQLQVADAGSSIRGVAWGSRTAWIAIDSLYGVRLEDGATVSRGP
ncbi:MAG: PQQ-binding-like beta-propeller repeat protein [Chloroflexales bacterium]